MTISDSESQRECSSSQYKEMACNVRMYETHYPGFCYLKDGKYRRTGMNNANVKAADPVGSSDKIRALLFTDNELDIQKVLCLHVLGTNVQSRRHIQRKDDRLCTFVKNNNQGNKRFTLQALSHRNQSCEKESSSVYENMLPNYILEVLIVDRNLSTMSLYPSDSDNNSDEELGKKRRLQVPVYVNNDIRAIVESVLEALDAVNSPKLKELLRIARNPEELKNLLSREDIQEYMIDLAGNQLVKRATAYDFLMTYPTFEKAAEDGTLETVAKVLEITAHPTLRNMIHLTRKAIYCRYAELVHCNVLPGKNKRTEMSKPSSLWKASKTSFLSGETSSKTCSSETNSITETLKEAKSVKNSDTSLLKFFESNMKNGPKTFKNIYSHGMDNKTMLIPEEIWNRENSVVLTNNSTNRNDFILCDDEEINKYDLKNLNNSQRILLGLKVASLKSRPVNMHQFENKKKVKIAALITSVMRPTNSNHNDSITEDNSYGLERKRPVKEVCRIGSSESLTNLTRGFLSNFRHDIETTENKKRVKEFISAQL